MMAADFSQAAKMSLTYCMTSNCPLSPDCQRFENDAAQHALHRTYADFSEELIRRDGQVTCPFFIAKESENS